MRKAARDFCPEERRRRAEECHRSGKTVKVWRVENGMTPRTYYYRPSKARGAACPKLCMNSGKGYLYTDGYAACRSGLGEAVVVVDCAASLRIWEI